ncbi:hypothetical protein [uncultured Dokdonia sp.]|uniref:hypothetical protein n=1 Tax=uncultured Dokdonia sp. TaxID=575653 RepID=UPI0026202C8D|nr:hypothetical protein [uncultured Dokdonia sp.]
MDKISFKKWAFHFMIWVIIINSIIYYLTANYVNKLMAGDSVIVVISRLGLVGALLLVLTLLFIILSIVKKEKRNYQFWIAAVGIFLFGGFQLLMAVFS